MTRERSEQYRSFVEQSPTRDDGYLFDQPRARFRPEPGDELVAAPQPFEVVGISADLVKAAFDALRPGPCSHARLLVALGPQLDSFLEQTFGKVVFAPAAVAALEVELPCLEIVRFAGSPYEVVRAYWRNMIAVRRRLEQAGPPADAGELRRLLLELHTLTLLGEGDRTARSSFYLPASALGRKRPTPGTFYEGVSEWQRRGDELIITSGARVSVPLLGGQHYWQLLAESVSDLEAVAAARQLEVDGLTLGQVVQARAEDEAHSRPWFLPSRPLLDAHFEALVAELRRASAAEAKRDIPEALSALAAFHYRFVRMHPLPSANQSISMCFVNATLHRLLGIGIPHLLLDQLALRFTLPAYQELFARAVAAWGPSASHRWGRGPIDHRGLLRMRADLNGFVSELSETPSLVEARALLPERPEPARLALL